MAFSEESCIRNAKGARRVRDDAFSAVACLDSCHRWHLRARLLRNLLLNRASLSVGSFPQMVVAAAAEFAARATLSFLRGSHQRGILRPPKEINMNRPIFVFALFAVASAALGAQQADQSSPYQGTSNPPSDDAIVVTTTPQPKPRAGQPLKATVPVTAPAASAQAPTAQAQVDAGNSAQSDPDAGIVSNSAAVATQPVSDAQSAQPGFSARNAMADPDADIVHPAPLGPGQLGEGTNIRVTLLDRLSTWDSERGQAFRSKVVSDVMQGGQVVIPAGAEIDGRVVEVSSGHFGGHGSMRLRPETVTLADGTRYELRAEVTGTPGSRTRVGSEGAILPGSRVRRDGFEYGGAVGAGVITGAVLGGPLGAVAGGAIGAGAVTAHLLIDHPQATLEPGAVLQFTLTDTLSLTPAAAPGN